MACLCSDYFCRIGVEYIFYIIDKDIEQDAQSANEIERDFFEGVKSGSSEQKRVGGEIVEQGWIVSVPWGIVPGGEPTAAEGGEEKECHENPIIGILLDQQVQQMLLKNISNLTQVSVIELTFSIYWGVKAEHLKNTAQFRK